MYLVIGATGLVGSTICGLLASKNERVRALVRATSDPSKVESLKSQGVDTVLGDLKDRSSLDAACKGVTTVISTASSTLSRQEGDTIKSVDLDGQLNLIDAAKNAGVERFIFLSFGTGSNPDLQYPLKAAKHAVEQRLAESGMNYTVVQASYFMEVWLSPALGFDFVNGTAQLYGDGHNPISWISFLNVAQGIVTCVDHPAASNSVFSLGGPEALSPREVVKIFEEESGQDYEVSSVPVAALKGQMDEAQDPLQISFAALMLEYARGDEKAPAPILESLPKLTSVREYARTVLAPA